MLAKIKKYVKENKFYTLTMIIGTILLMLQMKFVVLYADDLFLGIISKQGVGAAFKHLAENYMNWGGGPTPFIAIIFLMFRIGIWKVFNCAMIVLSIILTVRMITYNKNINKAIIAICMWILIYILNIYISAETLYWLDGNLAYVLTAFQMIVYFYYLYSRIIMKVPEKKYDYIVLVMFAFFAGWSGPQAGAISVLVPLALFAWTKFIEKQKIKRIYIISWVIALVGFLVYFLAPGNAARSAESFPVFTEYNIIEKILYRVDSIWNLLFNFKIYHFASIPFYLYLAIGLLSIIAIKKSKQEENQKISKIVNIISKCILIFLALNFIISMNTDKFLTIGELILDFNPLTENLANGTFNIKMLIPYAVTTMILIISVLLAYYISYKEKNPLLIILFLSALLGQAMMLLSPYSPLRTTFITVMLLWISIAYLISIISKENISIIGVISLVLAITYDVKVVIAFLLLHYILKNAEETDKNEKNKKELLLIGGLFIIITGIIYLQTLKGYRENSIIYHENLQRIEQFKENPSEDNVLYLKESVDAKYGFTGFVGVEWIETSVKQYFELEEDVVLKYERGGM